MAAGSGRAGLGEEPSAEAARTVLTLIGLALMPMAMPKIAGILGLRMDSPETIRLMRDHVAALARISLESGRGH